jgi:hypothetical protein
MLMALGILPNGLVLQVSSLYLLFALAAAGEAEEPVAIDTKELTIVLLLAVVVVVVFLGQALLLLFQEEPIQYKLAPAVLVELVLVEVLVELRAEQVGLVILKIHQHYMPMGAEAAE